MKNDDPITIRPITNPLEPDQTEFVERKGIGHPDSLCDGIAEEISRALSEVYLENFDRILHHNTDKLQLIAGETQPAFGGGEVTRPITIVIGGRATTSYNGTEIPVHDIAEKATRRYLLELVPALRNEYISVDVRIGDSSQDLQSLFDTGNAPKSNDTSMGIGYAPLSKTEKMIYRIEQSLPDLDPAIGKDIKIMGHAREGKLTLTVAAAMISSELNHLDDYLQVKQKIHDHSKEKASKLTDRQVEVAVNTADDLENESVYLTETGLSAEMGDDGMVGRGNRTNGLINPYRPMTMEAACGKNPVTHVGKIYNVLAIQIAKKMHHELHTDYSEVRLLSQIGAPITEPLAVDIETTRSDADQQIVSLVEEQLEQLPSLTDQIIRGEVQLF